MTAEVKTKVIDNVTRTLVATYSNYTTVRKCKIEDFEKVNQKDDFLTRASVINNIYCPDSYDDVWLTNQKSN